jgi:hypothetical protein
MVSSDKFPNALRSLNHVLVLARGMAYEGADNRDIGDALDIAEYLPRLLASAEDQTEAFRACLIDLGSRWPAFNRALAYFDGPTIDTLW